MNRRSFVTCATFLPAALTQALGQITHVEPVHTGEHLKSSVVKGSTLPATGDSPGAKARVHFNGPTDQLSALAAGVVTLEPGSRPHPPHHHPEEELMMVTEGNGEIEIAGTTTQVQGGDMMFAEANVTHGITNTGKSRMTFYFVKMAARDA